MACGFEIFFDPSERAWMSGNEAYLAALALDTQVRYPAAPLVVVLHLESSGVCLSTKNPAKWAISSRGILWRTRS